jgi:hypothetical protein
LNTRQVQTKKEAAEQESIATIASYFSMPTSQGLTKESEDKKLKLKRKKDIL